MRWSWEAGSKGIGNCAVGQLGIWKDQNVRYAKYGLRQLQIKNCRTPLHLVPAEVFVVKVLEHFAEVVGGEPLGVAGGDLGGLEDIVFDVDRAIHAQGQRQRVGGARVDADDAAVALHPDHGKKGVVAQFRDDDLADL